MPTLIVSVDVEEDCPGGRVQAQTTLRDLPALEGLQSVCERLGVRPTYLCTWPVATRDEGEFLGAWDREGRAEVGSLLNPWVTPPFDANENRLEVALPHRLSTGALHAKIAALTAAVAARTRRRPTSFRAGGFGINGATLQAIEREGYRVDASVTPLFDRRGAGSVDHRDAPDVPYFPDRQRVHRRGASPVLEIPVSAGLLHMLPAGVTRALTHLPQALGVTEHLRRAGGLQCHGLTSAETVNTLCRLADVLVARDVPVLHYTLRSSELAPGAAGATPGETGTQPKLEVTERFLAYALHTLGVIPRTLAEFADLWAGGG